MAGLALRQQNVTSLTIGSNASYHPALPRHTKTSLRSNTAPWAHAALHRTHDRGRNKPTESSGATTPHPRSEATPTHGHKQLRIARTNEEETNGPKATAETRARRHDATTTPASEATSPRGHTQPRIARTNNRRFPDGTRLNLRPHRAISFLCIIHHQLPGLPVAELGLSIGSSEFQPGYLFLATITYAFH